MGTSEPLDSRVSRLKSEVSSTLVWISLLVDCRANEAKDQQLAYKLSDLLKFMHKNYPEGSKIC